MDLWLIILSALIGSYIGIGAGIYSGFVWVNKKEKRVIKPPLGVVDFIMTVVLWPVVVRDLREAFKGLKKKG